MDQTAFSQQSTYINMEFNTCELHDMESVEALWWFIFLRYQEFTFNSLTHTKETRWSYIVTTLHLAKVSHTVRAYSAFESVK